MEIDAVTRKAELVPWFHDKNVLIWEHPGRELMKVFGFEGDPVSLYRYGERDVPGMVTYQEFPQEAMVRMRISDHIFETAAMRRLHDFIGIEEV